MRIIETERERKKLGFGSRGEISKHERNRGKLTRLRLHRPPSITAASPPMYEYHGGVVAVVVGPTDGGRVVQEQLLVGPSVRVAPEGVVCVVVRLFGEVWVSV